jgi:hypothetical protein
MSEIILPDGIVFGCQPRETEPGAVFRSASAAGIEPLPRSEFRDWDLSSAAGKSYNQGSTGSCVGHGTAKGAEIAYRLTGAQVGQFNGFVVYANTFARGVSWRSGTTLEAGLESIRDIGVPEVSDDFPAQATTRWPADWKARCARHRVLEFIDFDGNAKRIFELIWTVGQKLGFPSVIGSSRAWGGGHCVCCCWGRKDGNVYRIGGPQSWGDWTNCGRPGFWEHPESAFPDLDSMGSWGCTSTTEPDA